MSKGNRPGHVVKEWTVSLSVDEHEGNTRATAYLRGHDKEMVGVGFARLNPADHNIAKIGDELAVARALADLANRLLAVTEGDIESSTHQSVTHLHV